jgi:hypothetical protein
LLKGACEEGSGAVTTCGRVLVVDDELHVRELLRDFLTTVGDEWYGGDRR